MWTEQVPWRVVTVEKDKLTPEVESKIPRMPGSYPVKVEAAGPAVRGSRQPLRRSV